MWNNQNHEQNNYLNNINLIMIVCTKYSKFIINYINSKQLKLLQREKF